MGIYLRGKSWYYDFHHNSVRYSGSFGPISRRIAKQELSRKKAAVIENRLHPAKACKSPRFDAFTVDYLTWIETSCKPLTADRVRQTLTRFAAFIGSKRLDEVTAWHLEQWKKARKEAGKAPGTINVELQTVKGVFSKAIMWGKLDKHPGVGVKLLQDTRRAIRFLSEEEESQLLDVCSPALRCVVQVGLLTGFRRRELASLRPEDVDLDGGLVSVAACYAKNSESRTLPMGARLKTILREAVTASGSAATVLMNEHRRPWHLDTLSGQFRMACQEAGIGSLGLHTLRHTFASRLVMAGIDLSTVKELMGHQDIAMTLRYAHLSPLHKRTAMETLESRFSAPSPANVHNTPQNVPSREVA